MRKGPTQEEVARLLAAAIRYAITEPDDARHTLDALEGDIEVADGVDQPNEAGRAFARAVDGVRRDLAAE
jgi:hypothetical protein